jgi:hypothetical protein
VVSSEVIRKKTGSLLDFIHSGSLKSGIFPGKDRQSFSRGCQGDDGSSVSTFVLAGGFFTVLFTQVLGKVFDSGGRLDPFARKANRDIAPARSWVEPGSAFPEFSSGSESSAVVIPGGGSGSGSDGGESVCRVGTGRHRIG